MTTYGWKLMAELHGPGELVRQAVAAERAGLEFVAISDHFHPWLGDHEHSPFAWSVLGAVAHATERVGIATGLTCPTMRYHPAIVAQAAATVATMSGGRFTLAVGAGERLNEHIVGEHFPAIDQRQAMLAEAIGMISALWSGEWITRRGQFFDVEDARIYDLPERSIPIVMGVSGDASLDVAAECGVDGIMATDADPTLIEGWVQRGGASEQTWTEVPFAFAEDGDDGLRLAHERFRFGIAGWKVMSELPNPVNFDAATAVVEPDDLADSIPHGPDPKPYVDAIDKYRAAGFDRISIVPVGDHDATLTFWTDVVRPLLDR